MTKHFILFIVILMISFPLISTIMLHEIRGNKDKDERKIDYNKSFIIKERKNVVVFYSISYTIYLILFTLFNISFIYYKDLKMRELIAFDLLFLIYSFSFVVNLILSKHYIEVNKNIVIIHKLKNKQMFDLENIAYYLKENDIYKFYDLNYKYIFELDKKLVGSTYLINYIVKTKEETTNTKVVEVESNCHLNQIRIRERYLSLCLVFFLIFAIASGYTYDCAVVRDYDNTLVSGVVTNIKIDKENFNKVMRIKIDESSDTYILDSVSYEVCNKAIDNDLKAGSIVSMRLCYNNDSNDKKVSSVTINSKEYLNSSDSFNAHVKNNIKYFVFGSIFALISFSCLIGALIYKTQIKSIKKRGSLYN
jgi:hypothetical protein